ncbi:CDP-alcohol phosphatidyltransferase family protein [Paenarthrobacter sp. Z7-10]|uniref:CDP-alcohol phosphatidyltransferase family protein n=1 Tax=Paenarthrobacter sp. Z7-10 TaxID=2787635 RepID=UPI0022A97D82|nr:CDP-alcohol phosphatidyltransferase family protein [Paenarthrobacter sp. Z7-10]MCZ2402528.1 CDP-alcohol phosphatidyltransferase family protein [Paenarthrobacter sp. Z7-10]
MLLGVLWQKQWQPGAWGEFLEAAALRSFSQARARPGPFLQVTALHLAIGLAADRRHGTWVALSWALAGSHLGLLDAQQNLGWADTVTLIRANLPVLEDRLGRWIPVLALASDWADGRIARKLGAVTLFGQHADFLADTAFWTWFMFQHETSRREKLLTFFAWAVPLGCIAARSFATGRMVDIHRSRWLRPSAAIEVLIGASAVRRLFCRNGAGRNT